MKDILRSEKACYYYIYEDSPKESFMSCNTKEEAEITAWFLNKDFRLASDYGVTVEKNNGREKYASAYLLMLPKEAKQYRNDIDKMITAYMDFWRGWTACKKYFDITDKE